MTIETEWLSYDVIVVGSGGAGAQAASAAAELGASVLFFDLGITDAITDKHRTYAQSFVIPVNYKTFVMIRGEPYVSFFFFLILYLLFSIISKEKDINRADYIFLTLLMGGLGLSRQWGLLLLPGIFLTIFLVYKYKDKEFSKKYTRLVFSSSIFSFPLYFWFYILYLLPCLKDLIFVLLLL